ncbi:hypothetical protein CPB83DRAFT_262420 [Crepidotus variabilis]|uniref:DUF1168-domain-containing protein n=1 Tax=Crepidotus variabilis TaxID=179855 RepID=A0A9P6JRA1_9AGAR|nr:hypothetical protein CPB83DRAFT_262420 [Crepidotus variabilis]
MTSPGPSESSIAPANRHAMTAVEKQRSQLERLLKDPLKPAYIPPPPKDKSIRPAREMMKNVQGSSAGAGSGEFHVYKASRRREYERLKLLEDESAKEAEVAEFERKRKEAEDITNAKTAKNRAKRQKKKDRAKTVKEEKKEEGEGVVDSSRDSGKSSGAPLKKRRLVNGTELVFKKPGEGSDEDSEGEGPAPAQREEEDEAPTSTVTEQPAVIETARIMIVEDD